MQISGTTVPTTDLDGEPPVVAVVGLGAMGSRIAANLVDEGHRVVVTNRTAAAVSGLVAAGATSAASPRLAAAEADVVLVVVRDDDASRQVWTDHDHGVLAGLRPGAVGIECSTVSPRWVTELAGIAARAGADFLEAPIVGSRPQAEARALVHLLGGPQSVLDRVGPVLAVSAARLHRCGDVGAAATTKLVVNALLAIQVAAMAELLGVVERSGLDLTDTIQLLTELPVTSPAAARAAGVMHAGAFAPNFPVDLVAKDLRYLTRLAAEQGGEAPMVAAALGEFGRSRAAGHGQDDLTAIARTHLRTERTHT